MPLFGHLEEFCTDSVNISTYLDRVEQFFGVFFIANDIGCGNQTKCQAILLSAIGEKTYRVLKDLCTPQKPSDKSLEEITQLLLEHFKTKHPVVAESFKFYNASSFTRKEFSRFCALNGIKHVRCVPYHPSSNGLAERAMQTIKSGLKKVTGDLETRLLRVLPLYRLLPQSTTGRSPAILLMGRQPRSRLDLVYPDLSTQVTTKIDNAKRTTDKIRVERMFHIGDTVSVVNFQGRPKWLGRVLEEQFGPLTFRVRLEDGRLWKRHVDHILVNIPTEPVVRGSEESR